MSGEILTQLTDLRNIQYDFIPYANWDGGVKGDRPAPYKLGQLYGWDDYRWGKCKSDRVGIRLNDLVLVDYDGNKENAVGEIPSVAELAAELGYSDVNELYEKALFQWNAEHTSLHFIFKLPPGTDKSLLKNSNGIAKNRPFFWKHIDLKTVNQLVYLKTGKENRLLDIDSWPIVPDSVFTQFQQTETHVNTIKLPDIPISECQREKAQEWLNETCVEIENLEEGDRNNQLNTFACTASGLVAGGSLDNQETYTQLYNAALAAKMDLSEIVGTLESAWLEGFRTPRREAPYSSGEKLLASDIFSGREITNTNVDLEHEERVAEIVAELPDDDPDMGLIYSAAKRFNDEWVMTGAARYTHIESLAEYQKGAFDQMFASTMPVKPGKGFKRFKPSEIAEKSGMKVVLDRAYRPDQKKLFYDECTLMLNSCRPYLPERPSDAEVARVKKLIIDHVDWLIEDTGHQNMILQWMAWQVQNTGKLIKWLPLIIGCLGDGKSALFNLVAAAIGHRNTKIATNDSLCSGNQPWGYGCAVTSIEELKADPKISRKIYNDLKIYISEQRVPITDKYVKEETMRNTINYIAFSNYSNAIAISRGDRRWFVLHTRHFGLNGVTLRTQTDMKDHFDDLMDVINHDKYHAAVHWALKELPISPEFSITIGRAPITQFAEEMVNETASENELILQSYLENAREPGGTTLLLDNSHGFRVRDFYDLLPTNYFSGFDKKPSDKIIGRWLRNLGYECKTRRYPIDHPDPNKRGTTVNSFKK